MYLRTHRTGGPRSALSRNLGQSRFIHPLLVRRLIVGYRYPCRYLQLLNLSISWSADQQTSRSAYCKRIIKIVYARLLFHVICERIIVFGFAFRTSPLFTGKMSPAVLVYQDIIVFLVFLPIFSCTRLFRSKVLHLH